MKTEHYFCNLWSYKDTVSKHLLIRLTKMWLTSNPPQLLVFLWLSIVVLNPSLSCTALLQFYQHKKILLLCGRKHETAAHSYISFLMWQ
jgi:hypothetical protein